MVRQEMYNRYGESAYEDGYRIYTTITRKVQQAAQQAVRNNVLDYDMRHGYRGPANVLWKVGESAWDNNKITDTLKRCQPMVRCCLPQSPAPILSKRRRCWRTGRPSH